MTSLKMIKGRKTDGISLNSMMLLSCLLHALILSIIFLSPSWPKPRWTFGPVYTVELVSIPTQFIENKEMPSSAEKVIDLGLRNHAVVIKKNVDDVLSARTNKLETQKNVTMDNVDKAIEDIRQKATAHRDSSLQVSSRGDVEMTMKMKVYYSVIWSKIREQWTFPEGILSNDDYEAIIAVTILRNGIIADIDFEKKSGNRYFDESAVKAIRKASPLPALPEWLRESSLEVGIRFHASELR
ncbi:MAG: TonB C-terminal domain-containing protein [Deltaproteobacteria bacterium]|nr:TonB C-terminal domain-containing protein [Deltaproteobacteria bacterium]